MTRLLIAVESVVVVGLIVALLVVTAIQVVGRYVLNIPIIWGEEVSQLGIVWLAFIGAALVSAKSDHVTMRLLGSRLGRRGRVSLAFLAHLLVIATCIAMVVISVQPTIARMRLPLPATHWPAGFTYLGAIIGFVLMSLHSAINAWVIARGGYDEAQDDLEGALF